MLSTALYFHSHGNVPVVLEDQGDERSGEERRWGSRLPCFPSLPLRWLQGRKVWPGCRSLERRTGAGSWEPGTESRQGWPLLAWLRARVLVRFRSNLGAGKALNHGHALSRRDG